MFRIHIVIYCLWTGAGHLISLKKTSFLDDDFFVCSSKSINVLLNTGHRHVLPRFFFCG